MFLFHFNAVGEFDAGYHFWQVILPVEPPPRGLRGLDQLENHDHAGVMRQTAFAARRAMADRCERALYGIARADTREELQAFCAGTATRRPARRFTPIVTACAPASARPPCGARP